jgi:hypothetical protein
MPYIHRPTQFIGAHHHNDQHGESMGYKVKTLRSDYFSTFLASDLEVFRNKRNIEHQASSPHSHHQNTVEREIQTLIGYVSAVLHGTELL